jgi:cell division transport system permease protein
MRALRYFFSEAIESLWRGRSAAIVSMLTIAAGLFVLGFFLIVNANLQRLVARWSESAELSIYLQDDATDAQRAAVQSAIERSQLGASVQYLSKDDARKAFMASFPDLAAAAGSLDRNPFPASLEVRLTARARGNAGALDLLAESVQKMPGVADVRYDRRWLTRLSGVIRLVRGIGLAIVFMLALASALTVANVVRLAAAARRDEIEIMQLVGAPFAYIRGPFIMEGLLQGGIGAFVALVALGALFAALRARFGAAMTEAVGLPSVAFLPASLAVLLVFGGMALGCLGAYAVARRVR